MLVGIFTIRNWTKNMTKNILLICRLAKLIFLTCQKKKKNLGPYLSQDKTQGCMGEIFLFEKRLYFVSCYLENRKFYFLNK
jgi:hypothetical protein